MFVAHTGLPKANSVYPRCKNRYFVKGWQVYRWTGSCLCPAHLRPLSERRSCMLTLTPIRSNGKYYVELAVENYHANGGEPPGRWIGGGASALGLPDRVNTEALRNTLRGFAADDPESKLVQNAGKSGRQRGHDATFTAPKSVSVLWAISPEWMRQDIQAAQREATEAAIEYLQENAAFTRRGAKGQSLERAKLVVASFEHCTSRAQDPHLHTHCLIQNLCVRKDGTTGTLFGEVQRDENGRVVATHNPLYRHQKAAGAVYRSELAASLRAKLGIDLVPAQNGFSFEVKGIPESALQFYSKRRQEIEKKLHELGLSSPEAAERVTLATREKKEEVHRPRLFERWTKEAKEWGLSCKTALALCFQEQAKPNPSEIESVLRAQVEKLGNERTHYNKKDLVEAVANELAPTGTRSSVIAAAIEHEIYSGEVVSLRWDENDRALQDPVLTTKATLQIEWGFIQTLARSKSKITEHRVDKSVLDQVIAERKERGLFPLDSDQVEALTFLTCGQRCAKQKTGTVRVITGDPGTGKTTLLREAKNTWEKAGYRVLGASLAGRAAEVLQADTISRRVLSSDGKKSCRYRHPGIQPCV